MNLQQLTTNVVYLQGEKLADFGLDLRAAIVEALLIFQVAHSLSLLFSCCLQPSSESVFVLADC